MAKRKGDKEQGYSAGVIIGRVLSLPFIAARKILPLVLGFDADAKKQYNSMGNRSAEEIVGLATGKKYGTPAEKAAALKYTNDVISNAKKRIDGE